MISRLLPIVGFLAICFAVWSDFQQRQPVQLLFRSGAGTIPVATDRENLSKLAALAPSPGNIFRVPNTSRVRIIERGFGATLIEIMDGDQAGRRGWVFSEWVLPK